MRITGLEEYVPSLKALARLGSRGASFSIQLRGPKLANLVALPPRRRLQVIQASLESSVRTLTSKYSLQDVRPRDSRMPWTVDARSDVATLLRLQRSPLVAWLSLDALDGVRRRTVPRAPRLHTVRARVAIQIEGQTKGMQTVEESFMVVIARSPLEAQAKLRRHWRDYAAPYLSPAGELVRWQLEAIIEVHETFEIAFDPRGTEVYSSRSSRRIKAEHQWHPRGAAA